MKESDTALLTLKSHKPIIVDSDASHKMINDENLFNNIRPATGNVNGPDVHVEGIGNLKLFNKDSKAFYMLEFTSNLLSVQKAVKDLDCLAIFSSNEFSLLSPICMMDEYLCHSLSFMQLLCNE